MLLIPCKVAPSTWVLHCMNAPNSLSRRLTNSVYIILWPSARLPSVIYNIVKIGACRSLLETFTHLSLSGAETLEQQCLPFIYFIIERSVEQF